MDRSQMESVIDRLRHDEINDALGLLRLLERVEEITSVEAETLRLRVEARAEGLRAKGDSLGSEFRSGVPQARKPRS